MAEYYEGFAAVYDRWAADMTEDVPFYVELAGKAEEPVVELAVGTGRVAIPVARETGRRDETCPPAQAGRSGAGRGPPSGSSLFGNVARVGHASAPGR